MESPHAQTDLEIVPSPPQDRLCHPRQAPRHPGRLRFQTRPPRAPEEVTPEDGAQTTAAAGTHQIAGPIVSRLSRPALLTLQRAPFAVRALNHLTFGATPALVSQFNALGANDTARLTAFVDQQLNPAAIDDSAFETRLSTAGYTTLAKSLTQLWTDHVASDPVYDVRMRPAWEVQRGALARAVHSRRQLQEVMVAHWQNHFNVTVNDFSAGPVSVQYNRDVIRANCMGNFRTFLEAVATSTAAVPRSETTTVTARNASARPAGNSV
ncbi:MAG: DUF1800 domain-containing protein [Aquincola sp.]|nr:DUF1800 domain-containing protein [Aquincola sp.]